MTDSAIEKSHFRNTKREITPGGHAIEVLHTETGAIVSGATPAGGRLTVVVVGGGDAGESGVAEFSVGGILGGVWDTLVDVAGKLKGLLSCTPVQTTTVNVGPDGKVTGVTVTNTCVPG